MSDATTLETDDAQFGTGRVSVEFARRLERERDEARRYLKLEQSRVWAAMLIIQKSDDERDELRARIADLEADYRELALHHNQECPCGETYSL